MPHLSPSAQRTEDSTRLLADLAATTDPDRARSLNDQIVRLNQPMAVNLAHRYSHRGVETDDLEQVAMLGLCKAVRGYVHRPGHTFAGYAVPTITGELKRYFRDHGWLVRPARRLQEVGQAARQALPECIQSLQREPTDAEVATLIGVSTQELRAARVANSSYQGLSIDAPTTTSGYTWADTLADDADDPFDSIETRTSLAPALAELPSRDRTILRLRFVEELTQSEIAERIGVSQMQVSRLLARTLDRLRLKLGADPTVEVASAA
ncbi:MAG: sigma-70 family RNA polymerase sigma factor [Lapillicoccus sp.]